MKDTFRLCRKCGKPVGVLKTGLYKSILVNADPVEAHPDPLGDIYYRFDGSKMRGSQTFDYADNTVEVDIVWKPHRCGAEE